MAEKKHAKVHINTKKKTEVELEIAIIACDRLVS
jgi:hypothetical protein